MSTANLASGRSLRGKGAALAWLCVAVALAVHVFGILVHPKWVAWDARRGVLAAMQYELGRSPNIATLTSADPKDLSKDEQVGIGSWPPGYQAVPFSFRRLGASWVWSLKIPILLCTFIGLAAWGYYFSLFGGPKWLPPLLLLSVLLATSTIRNIVEYGGGDLLAWTFAPVVIITNVLGLRIRKPCVSGTILAFAGGFGALAIFLLKYSAVFIGIGMAAAWLWSWARRWTNTVHIGAWFAGAVIGAATIQLAGFPWGPTPASTLGEHLGWIRGLMATMVWPTAMTDLSSLIDEGCRYAAVPFDTGRTVLTPVIGLGLIVFLLFLGFQHGGITEALRRWCSQNPHLATVVTFAFLADTSIYGAMVFAGGGVWVDARIARVSGLMMLPVVSMLLLRCLATSSQAVRRGSLCICAIFAAPSLLGVTQISDLMAHVDQERLLCGSLIRISRPQSVDQQAFYRELQSRIPSTETVLYVVAPDMLYARPAQRFLIAYIFDGAGYSAKRLRSVTYRGKPRDGVALLLPLSCAADGKLAAIQASFAAVSNWEFVPLESAPKWGLWLSQGIGH